LCSQAYPAEMLSPEFVVAGTQRRLGCCRGALVCHSGCQVPEFSKPANI
jgi:hypothetical protein